jgi:peptidoglycan hydrolase-like protein with peptidoglycan-binding domain
MVIAIPQVRAGSPNILVGVDMTVGSSNQNVAVLQGLLSEMGYLNVPVGIPLGYFGGLTRDAVASYQRSRAVSPAVGYFGPVTKTAMHSDLASHNYLKLLGW